MKFNFSFGKEWSELKRFERLPDNERLVVFYAENKASMNHFKLLIEYLTQKMNLKICYVTSVKDDQLLSDNHEKINSFFIGDGAARTKFFLSLKTKVLIMDMPDLNTYHIKKSKVFQVHYIYIFHSMFSVHSYLRKGALDNYDTIFCVGKHHEKEIHEIEKIYQLKKKNILEYGFGRLDYLLQQKKELKFDKNERLVIIAPTYGANNLLGICGIDLIQILLESNYEVLLRPHFRIFKESPKLIEKINQRFSQNPNFCLETGIIKSRSFHGSKCLISDWSGIALEYAFVFEKPTIFIDVPQKIQNKEFSRILLEPIEVSIREKIGRVISLNKLNEIPKIIEETSTMNMSEEIRNIRSKIVFNIGNSAEVGASYIKNLL